MKASFSYLLWLISSVYLNTRQALERIFKKNRAIALSKRASPLRESSFSLFQFLCLSLSPYSLSIAYPFKMRGSTFSLASNMKDWPPKVPDMQVWWRTTYLAKVNFWLKKKWTKREQQKRDHFRRLNSTFISRLELDLNLHIQISLHFHFHIRNVDLHFQ